MTIEFNCPSCSKVLKTADNKAGLSAKCPGCGQILVVPGTSSEEAGASPAAEENWSSTEPEGGGDAGAADEFAAAPVRERRPCPMCGQEILAVARVCRHCGERFDGGKPSVKGGKFEPTPIDAGEVLTVAWGTFKDCLGIAIVGLIIPGMINVVTSYGSAFAIAGLRIGVQQAGNGNQDVAVMGIELLNAFIQILLMGLSIFLTIGQAIFYLKLARGEEAVVGDLFGGGRYLLRGLGASILFGLMIVAGLLAVLVGAIVVALVFSPFMYFLVDRDEGVIATLDGTRKLTWPNLGSVFVLGLASIGISLAGVLACCIGTIFAAPFVSMIGATTYLMMSGQLSSRSQN